MANVFCIDQRILLWPMRFDAISLLFAICYLRIKRLPHGHPTTSIRLCKFDFKSSLKRVSGYAQFFFPHQDVCESRRGQMIAKNGTCIWDRI